MCLCAATHWSENLRIFRFYAWNEHTLLPDERKRARENRLSLKLEAHIGACGNLVSLGRAIDPPKILPYFIFTICSLGDVIPFSSPWNRNYGAKCRKRGRRWILGNKNALNMRSAIRSIVASHNFRVSAFLLSRIHIWPWHILHILIN